MQRPDQSSQERVRPFWANNSDRLSAASPRDAASLTSVNFQPEHGASALKTSGQFISRVDSMRDRGGILTTMNAANDNERDLLMGAIAIADFLGITRRQAYRLIHDDIIPSFKLGGTVAARRSSLRSWMNTAETRVTA